MRNYSLPIVLILLFLIGCVPESDDSIMVVVNVHLTQIIDKTTQKPIPYNTITLRWESENGQIINKQVFKNQQTLTTTVPADGKTRLWITVTAPGHESWENAIRSKLDESRFIEIIVEMERQVRIEHQGY